MYALIEQAKVVAVVHDDSYPFLDHDIVEVGNSTFVKIFKDFECIINTRYIWTCESGFTPVKGFSAELAEEIRLKNFDFDSFFAALDQKRSRAVAAIVECQALRQLGEPVDTDPADVAFLSAYNMIAEENRASLQSALDSRMPDDADLGTAKEVLLRVRNLQPWLPVDIEFRWQAHA